MASVSRPLRSIRICPNAIHQLYCHGPQAMVAFLPSNLEMQNLTVMQLDSGHIVEHLPRPCLPEHAKRRITDRSWLMTQVSPFNGV